MTRTLLQIAFIGLIFSILIQTLFKMKNNYECNHYFFKPTAK